jgi:bifunctional non-homologous end joining protein LigD
VVIAGRTLSVSNLDKVLWPATGWTKGQMIDYYARVAGVMVPHLAARPITLRRWPDGVEGNTFFQKHAPSRRPSWIGTVELGGVDYLRIDEPAALVWAANLAAIELHPGLARAAALQRPTFVVLDLDPGPPADVATCAEVAAILRGYLQRLGLQAWPKTSGSKGLQIYVPLGATSGFDEAREFALGLARLAEAEHPGLVVSAMDPALRKGKVMIDWGQNAPSRTTVAAYSLRARDRPTVSTPVTWEEVEEGHLVFGPDDVLERLDRMGDLMAAVLETKQRLPSALPRARATGTGR